MRPTTIDETSDPKGTEVRTVLFTREALPLKVKRALFRCGELNYLSDREVAADSGALTEFVRDDGRSLQCTLVRGRNGRVVLYHGVIAACRLGGPGRGDLWQADGGRESVR